MELTKYQRRKFVVEGVQVTEDNMNKVASWCGGTIELTRPKSAPAGDDGRRPYIKVNVIRAMNAKQTMAFPGDWVLSAGNGFKVYTNASFEKQFEAAA